MTKAQLYLLRADLLLGEQCCVRVAEGVEAQVRGGFSRFLRSAKRCVTAISVIGCVSPRRERKM